MQYTLQNWAHGLRRPTPAQWQRNSFRSTQNTGCVWIWYYWDISNVLWQKNWIEIKRYYHVEFLFIFFFLNLGGNKWAIPSQTGPAGAAKGTGICLPHVGMLRILTGFNKPRKAILLLLQSALQTHLYLRKPHCLRAHMRHPTTAPDGLKCWLVLICILCEIQTIIVWKKTFFFFPFGESNGCN